MTHDPDHDLRAMHPGVNNGLNDRRVDEAYRSARSVGGAEQEPWELRGVHDRPPTHRDTRGTGPRVVTTRVVLALLIVIALVAALVGRW